MDATAEPPDTHFTMDATQGGPKVTSQRFKLIAWPLIIGSAKFVQECAGTVTVFLGIKNKEVGVTSY